ncbi:hypothetical protein ABW21_db0203110 [Orbilia brochopaga]|nr:hypothetical protein ABW21_db0203110 [Drechslerella brochopaga]
MPTENEELLARISQLAGKIPPAPLFPVARLCCVLPVADRCCRSHAGQINRHKTAVASSSTSTASAPAASSRPPQQQSQASYPTRHQPYPAQHHQHRTWAPPARGTPVYRSRGRGGTRVRNRTLVLNSNSTGSNSNSNANNSPADTPNVATDDELMPDAADGGNSSTRSASAPAPGAGGSWVAKHDRHMQLINSSVYDQHLQARAKAIEQTRQDKLKYKEEREKAKLRSFLQGSKQYGIVSTSGSVRSKMAKVATYQHEIMINGARFKITVDGRKLVKVSGEFLSIIVHARAFYGACSPGFYSYTELLLLRDRPKNKEKFKGRDDISRKKLY